MSLIKQSKWAHDPKYNHILCGNLASSYREPIVQPVNIIDFQVISTERYYFLLLKCTQNSATIGFNMELEALSSKNQHLSLQDVPLVQLYMTLMGIYFALLFIWTGVEIRNYEFVIKLHTMLLVGILIKLVEMTSNYGFFILLNKFGSAHYITVFVKDIVTNISETVFLLILVLAALGWGINSTSTTNREKRLLLSMFVLFFGFKMLFSLCREPAICPAYILGYKIIRFVILFGIIIALNQNIESLRSQVAEENNRNQAMIVLDMFKLYRWAFLGYLVLPILFVFIQISFIGWQDEWLIVLSQEGLNLMVYCALLISFQPKRIHL